MGSVLAFTAVALVLVITPGADMALVTKVAVTRGYRAALATIGGIVAGTMTWGLLSALGLAALVAASQTAFDVLKIAGAAYLTFLGAQSIASSFRRRRGGEQPQATPGRRASFRAGLLTNLLNPKLALFYTSFLPQFIQPGQSVLALSVALAAIHAVLGIAWLSLYARTLVAARGVLERPGVRRALDRVTGTLLIAVGVRLATAGRR